MATTAGHSDHTSAPHELDPAQQHAADCLARLRAKLCARQGRTPGLFDRLIGRKPDPVPGLYLWGGVGRGKTWLMDRFYAELPFDHKRRVHFHRFMQDVHAALRLLPKSPDPLPIVAAKVAREARVLCLDEFHVQDIADAMLLAGFFKALFAEGVTLVTTSNVAPDHLYRHGLQRERFLPAIALIKQHTQVLQLDGDIDYRRAHLLSGDMYHVVDGDEAEMRLSEAFRSFSGQRAHHPLQILVQHRQITARAMANDVVWLDFDALCDTPRSAADYLELAQRFEVILLGKVPALDEARDDAAQRFVHLIDALYDQRTRLFVTAEADPEHLYRGRRHGFAFQRTASRLREMASAGWAK